MCEKSSKQNLEVIIDEEDVAVVIDNVIELKRKNPKISLIESECYQKQ